MVILRAVDMHWLEDSRDDQCLHGTVIFEVNGVHFVSPADGVLTLSAGALFLLRTLQDDHTDEHTVAEMNCLFPCCGFNLLRTDENFQTLIMGCPGGVDMQIRHAGCDVLFTQGDRGTQISIETWKEAVLNFAESVENFYKESPTRNAIVDKEGAEGWKAFWEEWRERMSAYSHFENCV